MGKLKRAKKRADRLRALIARCERLRTKREALEIRVRRDRVELDCPDLLDRAGLVPVPPGDF